MIKVKNNLPEDVRIKIADLLQTALQASIDLTYQSKQAHWNVKGSSFIALHELFDKASALAGSFSDDLAERMVQLGGTPKGTVKVAAKGSFLPEYPLDISSGLDHCAALSSAWGNFASVVRESIDKSTILADAGTADLFTGISRESDKMVWFIESHLVG